MSGEIDRVELLHELAGMAEATWKFFSNLKSEGFTDDQALKITMVWVRGILAGAGGESQP